MRASIAPQKEKTYKTNTIVGAESISAQNKGITLVALVITIMIMLILSGVVLYFTVGNNGIIARAKESKIQIEEAKAKEKLEIALADLQTLKYVDENYDEKEYINNYLSQENMVVIQDIVTVDGWQFKIDRSEPKIGENLGNGQTNLTGNSIDLLWSNSEPNDGFQPQTISIDLTNYKAVLIFTKPRSSASETASSTSYPAYTYGKIGETVYCVSGAKGSSGTWYTTFRSAVISSTGIEFGNGTYGQASSKYNSIAIGIPLYIWGIKQEI